MVALDDGSMFAAAADGVIVKKAGGAWEKVALPKAIEGLSPTGVYARTASDVWVSGVVDRGKNLYVGAVAASAEQADAIVAAFTEGNPKMKARVFCHEPQVKKELDWP